MFEPDAGKIQMPPWQRHSDTSRAAAISMYATAPTKRARVYRELLAALPGGLTDEELQDRLHMNPSTQRPRRIELEKERLVYDSHEERMTRAGRAAVVWKARR